MHDIVPPTFNHFTDDPELDPRLNFTFEKAQQRTVNAALSNTFGFGGAQCLRHRKKIQIRFNVIPAYNSSQKFS